MNSISDENNNSEQVNNTKIKNIAEENKYISDINLDNKFVGYYLEDSQNPIITDYLGETVDINKCILKGKNSSYKYVGIQEENKCFGTNILPNSLKKIDRKSYYTGLSKYNIYNQIYLTEDSFSTKDTKPKDIFNKYKEINGELNSINNNLTEENFVQESPLNPYALVLWLIIIIIIIFLVIEYVNKKTANKTFMNINLENSL